LKRRDFEKMLAEELISFGITTYEFGHRAEHPAVYFKVGLKTYYSTYPGTPSDYRGLLNRRSGLRRLLRSLGCKKAGE